MRKGLLVPYDGSKNATEALRLAIVLAKALGEKILVLNVQPSFHTAHTKMFFSEENIREYQQQLFREVTAPAAAILKDAGVEFEIKLRIGDAKEQICLEATGESCAQHACSSTGIRMIIMGSRGMNPILGGVMGSVSYGLVNAAPCPVTIVPFTCEQD